MHISEKAASWLHLDESEAGAGRLYVSQEHRADTAIQSEINRILRESPQVILHPVQLGELRQRQQATGGEKAGPGKPWSEEQKKVVQFMREGRDHRASDLHFLVGMEDITSIVFRIHGDLELHSTMETNEGELLASTIIQSMCDVAATSFDAGSEQDGRLRNEFVRGLGLYAARYSATPTEFGLYVVLRVIKDESEDTPSLDMLGFLPAQQQLIRRMLGRPEGNITLSGPTGCGKSTTMRTFCKMYQESSGYRRRMITVEDPPEGKIKGAVQTAIRADKNDPAAVTQAWQRALSALKRLDPDCVVVGEMRDTYSAKSCLSEGKSGNMVMSSTHANDPIGILDRLIDTFDIPVGQVADPRVMVGLISQRLVQILCPHCKKSWEEHRHALNEDDTALVTKYCNTSRIAFRHHEGCGHEDCWKGITGRRVIAEVIRPDVRFIQLYRYQHGLAARSYWIHTLQGITRGQHLMGYIHDGLVDPVDADKISPLDEDDLNYFPPDALLAPDVLEAKRYG
ncbi:Flp pilus assembly complex ATPase component TadA [Rahnella sp. BCC 1045]|uniref:GspE/PulE family protein n=1 Tax=Rahnella sp. BCC 1045 TaxID=2816251 RepID=UPI001C26649C|nr:ATPase, T2SS/T4P/T4SS family [Rahnella sp. BCC 1045]MBU9819680.1 Flp pilus assembly complex ATPase component TadA [Rahnella sp. BCC 1045]